MSPDIAGPGLRGMFRDTLRDERGRVVWRRDWQKNVIVADARRLLAGLLRGAPSTLGIKGLRVGSGNPSWDSTGPPAPSPTQAALVAPVHTLGVGPDLRIDYLDSAGNPSVSPTNRLQIFGTFQANVPPGGPHTLREFGLVATLNGTDVLINYRTHEAIAKDPTSKLERTIWLVL